MQKIILLFILSVVFSGNIHAQKKNKKEKKSSSVEQSAADKKVQYANTAIFIEAVKERLNGNAAQAENLLLDLIAKDSSHDAARYEYAKLLLEQYKYTHAIEQLKTAIRLCDTNIWYKVLLAETYGKTEQFSLSEKMWKEIIEKQPQNVEYLYYYTISLIYQNKFKEAINGYNLIETQTGVNEEITAAKKSIWLHLDKVDNATKEIEKLAQAFPSEPKYYLEIADMYIVNKMPEKAIPYLKKASVIEPNNPKINVILYNYYTENKKYEEAFSYLEKAFSSPALPLDEKIKILLGYYTSPKDSVKSNRLLNNMLQAHPNDPIAWSMYGDFMTRDNHLKEAKTAYEKVISFDESKYKIWEQYLAILLDLGEFDEALKQSETAMSLFPNQALPYLANGMSLLAKEEYQEAVSILEEGKNYVVEEFIAMQIHFFLAESHSQLKNFEESDKYYEDLIKEYPDNATFLNNLSYSLAERGLRLDYALQLAKKAVELSPNTATFEDTYAWAFFKKEDYKNAKLWLEKALKNGGDTSSEILLHYSEVLQKLGEIAKSEEYKQKAEQYK
ncbi:MAG: tetratricopeptide repeat protein [Bacteroidales bacterium]|jgi:tetratricopeptide (TPR) repeat protein|nr:tetratricopeptide repeat protein [Bacteroidales bacterium]